MKSKILILILPLAFVMTLGYSQIKTKKELKEEQNLEKQKQTEALVEAKDFIFIARYALPEGSGQIDLTTNPNFVKFTPDLIDSYLPFFGTAYAGIGYGGDAGIKFQGYPKDYKIVKRKKNYVIDVSVEGGNDVYRLSLWVSPDGSASLSVISNNRSTITYQGTIAPLEKRKEK